tara:strand:+ start:1818 stop:2135 length:318 start_codon:yes stop_codon:yes gene_type:complete
MGYEVYGHAPKLCFVMPTGPGCLQYFVYDAMNIYRLPLLLAPFDRPVETLYQIPGNFRGLVNQIGVLPPLFVAQSLEKMGCGTEDTRKDFVEIVVNTRRHLLERA